MQRRHDKVEQASRALVVGLGASGLSVARWLVARGVAVAITDSRERPPQLEALRGIMPDVALFLGGFSSAALERADMVVLSPGVPRTDPFIQQALQLGLPVIGDIELFARVAAAPVLAVTGSNGKSTVATLLAMMVEQSGKRVLAGGNLGTPALDLLAQPTPDMFVLELSSFQLESTVSLDVHAGAILNLSSDHMDRYASLDAYAEAKARIWNGRGAVIANRDDEVVCGLVPSGRPVCWFGLSETHGNSGFGLSQDGWIMRDEVRVIEARELRISGRHNLANAMASLALGHAAGLSESAMCEVLRRFRGLPHRMEPVADHAEVRWFNDSKATNVGATLAAVAGMDGPLVLIMGGDGKGQDFSTLRSGFSGKVRAAVLIGRDRDVVRAALTGVCECIDADDMHAAVRAASSIAQAGDAVLLSPACSSLDMFEGFEARGRAFADAVRGLQ